MAAPYTVRPMRAHEWREARALRLEALSDDAAAVAYLTTHDEAAARPDEYWRAQTQASSADAGEEARARQFVAISVDGTWLGTAVALVEEIGQRDYTGSVIDDRGGAVVGVYLRPEHRGRGIMEDVLDAVAGWLGARGLPRVRLNVHADNPRARRLYEKAGFRATGTQFTSSIGPEIEMERELSAGGSGSADRPR
jgi:RimJ/RimL family protein N-acetyltransferase